MEEDCPTSRRHSTNGTADGGRIIRHPIASCPEISHIRIPRHAHPSRTRILEDPTNAIRHPREAASGARWIGGVQGSKRATVEKGWTIPRFAKLILRPVVGVLLNRLHHGVIGIITGQSD